MDQPPQSRPVRIAAFSDVHANKSSQGVLQPAFAQAASVADVIVICGDLTDYGSADEGRVLVKELSGVRIPVVTVLGNHDYESGNPEELVSVLTDAGIHVLDGDTFEIGGVGFAGVKGFAGGFGRGMLGAWGEPSIKGFVHEALSEALKLENALAKLRTPYLVALLHYSPIRGTVEGEPIEIFPWLGCGRLEEPINRYPVSVAFHGHAHNGSPEGQTSGGVPVFNVAMPLLRKCVPGTLGFRVVEVGGEPVERRKIDRRITA